MRFTWIGRRSIYAPLGLISGLAVAQSGGSSPPESAQAADTDVVRQASDAFGVRIGTESFGLYDEYFARGFSLEAAGNYRLIGLFYVPAATPASPIVETSTMRVGLAALLFDFPAPSGVVDYALRGPAQAPFVELRAGFDSYQSPFVASDFSIENTALGLAGGVAVLRRYRKFATHAGLHQRRSGPALSIRSRQIKRAAAVDQRDWRAAVDCEPVSNLMERAIKHRKGDFDAHILASLLVSVLVAFLSIKPHREPT